MAVFSLLEAINFGVTMVTPPAAPDPAARTRRLAD